MSRKLSDIVLKFVETSKVIEDPTTINTYLPTITKYLRKHILRLHEDLMIATEEIFNNVEENPDVHENLFQEIYKMSKSEETFPEAAEYCDVLIKSFLGRVLPMIGVVLGKPELITDEWGWFMGMYDEEERLKLFKYLDFIKWTVECNTTTND